MIQPLVVGVILVAMLSGCASVAPRATVANIGYWSTATTDIVTTQAALGRGAIELNSLLGESPGVARMVVFKMAGFALMRIVVSAIESTIGRRLKWLEELLVFSPVIGMQAWATIHNQGVAR